MQSLFRSTIVVSSIVILTACSSGSDDNNNNANSSISTIGNDDNQGLIDIPGLAVRGLNGVPADQEFNPWLATIQTFRLDSGIPIMGDARVSTLQYNGTTTVQNHIDFYSAGIEIDTCEVFETGDATVDGTGDGDTNGPPFVPGGLDVVINTPSGTWFSITQGEIGIYEVIDELPDAIPMDATLAILGDVFPTVSGFPLIEPPVPVRIAPLTDVVTIDDEYRWEPVGGPGVYIRLAFLEFDRNGNFVDVRIGCDIEDDGEFELPASALFAIEFGDQGSTFQARYARTSRQLELHDGVVIFSRLRVAE